MAPTTFAALAAAAAAAVLAAAPVAAHADDDLESIEASIAPAGIHHFGVMVDAGVPEGAQASLVVRPWSHLRMHGGVGYNGIRTGYQGGVTLIPFSTWFTPTLTADYGAFPEGDATKLARYFDPTADSPALQRVGYHYANARVGLEFGRTHVTFYIDAGISRFTGAVHDELDNTSSGNSMITVTASDAQVKAWTASARIGWIIYL
jgi:hypothetical protein